jgi:hypothetical protein
MRRYSKNYSITGPGPGGLAIVVRQRAAAFQVRVPSSRVSNVGDSVQSRPTKDIKFRLVIPIHHLSAGMAML